MSKPRRSATKHNNRTNDVTRSMESVILALGSCLATPKAMRGLAARSSTETGTLPTQRNASTKSNPPATSDPRAFAPQPLQSSRKPSMSCHLLQPPRNAPALPPPSACTIVTKVCFLETARHAFICPPRFYLSAYKHVSLAFPAPPGNFFALTPH